MTVPSFRLEKGDALEIEHVLHDIRERDRDGMLLSVFRNGQPVSRKLSHGELADLYFDGKLRIRRGIHEALPETLTRNIGRALDSFAPRRRDQALLRHDYMVLCDRYHARKKAPKTPEGYARVGRICAWLRRRRAAVAAGIPARRLGIEQVSGSTIRNWHRRWVKSGRALSVLVPLDDGKGNRTLRLDPAIIDIVDRCIRDHWLTNERLPMSIAIEAIERAVHRYNVEHGTTLTAPSGTAIRKHVMRTYPEYDQIAHREGRVAAQQKYRHVRKAPEPQRPLEVVEIDHTRLDAFVLVQGPKGAEQRRPWLTVAICAATRMIVGYHMSFDAPSWSSIMAALSMGVRPKKELLAADPEIKSQWPVYGVPEMVKTDNGLEFHSNSLKAAAGHLGFEIQYTPRRQPFLKGRIERFFGEIARNMAAIPGRSFRDVRERGDYKSQEKTRTTLEQMHAMFRVWVVDYYHNRPHAGLWGRTPLEVWQEKTAAFDVRLPPSVDDLDALVGLVIDRTVTNSGVLYMGLDYQSSELQAIRRARSHMGKLWRVKVDPTDISTVLVFDEYGAKWLRVPSNDRALTDGLTLPMWKEIIEAARYATRLNQNVSRQTLLEARERLLAMAGRGTRSSPPKMSRSEMDWALNLDETSFADVAGLAKDTEDDTRQKRRRDRKSSIGDTAPVSQGQPALEKTSRKLDAAGSDAGTKDREVVADDDPDDPDTWR